MATVVAVASHERRNYLIAVLVIIGLTFVVRAHALIISSIHWDEGVYLVIAQRWLLGGLPYVAVWDQHPPGLPALLALGQLIIPDPVLGARLEACFAVAVTALLLHRFCVRYLDRPGAGLVAALLYIFCISRWAGLPANTEVFNNACTTSAAYLLYGATRGGRHRLLKSIAAAAILGVGLQIKYVVFPEAVILCLTYVISQYRQFRKLATAIVTAIILIVTGCIPTGLTVLYFWSHGALQPFLGANIGANIGYLTVVPTLAEITEWGVNGLAPVIGCLVVVACALAINVRWRWRLIATLTPEVWVLIWIAATVLNISLPLKFFNHYYFALYPPVCLAGSMALFVLAQNRRGLFAAGVAVLFATATPLWALGEVRAARSSGADAPRMAADFLTRSGAADSKVFVYDYDPVIYALARLEPPTPYVLAVELQEFSFSSRVNGVAEVHRVMGQSPDFIVLHTRLPGTFVPAALDAILARTLQAYRLVWQMRNGTDDAMVSIYRR